jgi:hypothetical protein
MLVVACSASARIVVNKSIDGVKLGATTSTVRKLLGRPTSTAKCSVFTVCVPLPGAFPGTVSWTYGSSQSKYVFIKGRVALMGAFSTSERTAAGVGPGTTLKVAKRRYPKLAFHHFLPGQQPSGYYVTASRPRRATTSPCSWWPTAAWLGWRSDAGTVRRSTFATSQSVRETSGAGIASGGSPSARRMKGGNDGGVAVGLAGRGLHPNLARELGSVT